MILSIGSIFLGYILKDLLVGLGTDFWNESIFILPEHNNQLDAEFVGLSQWISETQTSTWFRYKLFKLLPFFSSVLAVWLFLKLNIFVVKDFVNTLTVKWFQFYRKVRIVYFFYVVLIKILNE
jgi:hypothetical protein